MMWNIIRISLCNRVCKHLCRKQLKCLKIKVCVNFEQLYVCCSESIAACVLLCWCFCARIIWSVSINSWVKNAMSGKTKICVPNLCRNLSYSFFLFVNGDNLVLWGWLDEDYILKAEFVIPIQKCNVCVNSALYQFDLTDWCSI